MLFEWMNPSKMYWKFKLSYTHTNTHTHACILILYFKCPVVLISCVIIYIIYDNLIYYYSTKSTQTKHYKSCSLDNVAFTGTISNLTEKNDYLPVYSQQFPLIFHRTPRTHQRRVEQYVEQIWFSYLIHIIPLFMSFLMCCFHLFHLRPNQRL